MSGSYRAEKHGFAADAHKKTLSKWDSNLAMESMIWVSSKTDIPLPDGFNGEMGQTQAYLQNGYVLAKLADYAVPGCIKPSLLTKPPTVSFKQMELISVFLGVLKKHNLVQDTELFQTVDLYENTNMPSVIFAIGALGRTLQKDGRGFGKAESVGEKKNWTKEQLMAGQSIIGLQMGTNQCANQSGINMGKPRSIMD